MAKNKLSVIEKKKQELEQELSEIQNGLDKSIDDVREGVSSNLDPKNIIKKYPLPIVGASVLVGFLLGKEKKRYTDTPSRSGKIKTEEESRIAAEIKRIVAKKGMNLLLDFIDNKISDLKRQHHPKED
ncbi:MAG: hypothetical protein RI564_12360 [Gracilimonas sp.]|jgi:hypothetical protein|nr:hypothetical protein [Gracilimonas sp.]